MREALPIDAQLPRICAALRARANLVLVAEPGAGKTTRVPPALVDAGLAGEQQLVVLQPRRVAARAAAQRISEERGRPLGEFCGYQVRFERRAGARTRVLVVTEGILTRWLQRDPSLEGVSIVVLDEFHERSLHVDLALALLRSVQRELRPELKLLVMSATLEAGPIARYLDADSLAVEGRAHALETIYTDPPREAGAAQRALEALRVALRGRTADALCFLPGQGEIARVAEELAPLARELELDVLPLHGELRLEEQERALRPGRRRRLVLATNVAETSLTVPGVRIVVDTGLARVMQHDADSGLDRLELQRISLASAAQRAGRAAREGPGVVYRAWSRAEETLMRAQTLPEIRRVDLAGPALDLHAFGERDLASFAWFEAPEPAALARAEHLLELLGAIDRAHAITPVGSAMAHLPLHPRLARLLVAAHAAGLASDGALLAALLSERDLVRRAERAGSRGSFELASGPSDLLARRDLFLSAERGRGSALVDRNAARRVSEVAAQLERALANALGPAPAERAQDEALLRLIWSGYPDRVARRIAAGQPEALMVGGKGVVLSPDSVLHDEELFAVLDADQGAGANARARVYMASAVRREWLAESPAGLVEARAVVFDEQRERVVGQRQLLYEDLPLESSRSGAVDAELASARLLAEARARPAQVLRLPEDAQALRQRLQSLAGWMPELALPSVEDEALLEALEPWAQGKSSFEELRRLPWNDVLLGRLSRAQRSALDTHAPESLKLPSGNSRRLSYEPGKPPVLAVKLQELFGQAQTPCVAAGRVAIVLHLLAPNQRVVQVTQDLASFWNTTYAQVRKDLRNRYPRHPWPEDPWSAPPTGRLKPRGS